MTKSKFFKLSLIFLMVAAVNLLTFACGCESTIDWVMRTIEEQYFYDLPEDCVYEGDVKKFASTYLDAYSAYYTKSEYQELQASNNGSKSGVGISYSFIPEGVHPSGASGVHLEKVVGNSPAANAGMKCGEFVLGAVNSNGVKVDFTTEKDFTDYIDAKLTGEKFTFITDRGSYEVAKSEYTASYVYMATAEKDYSVKYDGGRAELVEGAGDTRLPAGAAYIRLDQFYGAAASEIGMLVEKFNALSCTSLIFDMRGNGGGYVNVMSDIAQAFIGEIPDYNPVSMRAVYKNGRQETFGVGRKLPREQRLPVGVKVSVLANNYTASASEALIGVLVDNGVIDYSDIYVSDYAQSYLNYSDTTEKNCRTYGKGIMQSTFRRAGTGEALKLTTAKIYWPKGDVSIHGVGLNTQMGCKTLPAEWSVTYFDEQLSLAIESIYNA